MSTEKIIKNQAKDSLKGNWTVLIAGIMFFLIILIAIEGASSVVGFLAGGFDNHGEVKNKLIDSLVKAGSGTVAFLFTPVANGVIKCAYRIGLKQKPEISDIFCYFNSFSNYIRTLLFNILLLIVYTVLSYGLDPYLYIRLLTGRDLQNSPEFDILTFVLVASALISVLIKVLVYLLFIHYQLMAYAGIDNISPVKAVFGMYGFAFRNFGSVVKLLFSFIGWLALCFFVVPAFYVLPYMLTSMSISAKWLFSLERNSGLLC